MHICIHIILTNMKLLFATRRWLCNQAGQAETIEMQLSKRIVILSVLFFPTGNSPVPVSSGFTCTIYIYIFSPCDQNSLFPKSSFFIKIEHNTEGELDGSNQLLLKIGGISLLIASGSWLKPNII